MTAKKLNEIVETAMFYLRPHEAKHYDWKLHLDQIVAVMPVDVLQVSANRARFDDNPNGTWDETWVEACQVELIRRSKNNFLG